MGKRATGAVFCAIAALLFAARYISAAILTPTVTEWNDGQFGAALSQVWALLVLSIIALVIGVFYLVGAETGESRPDKPYVEQTVMSKLIDGPADDPTTQS